MNQQSLSSVIWSRPDEAWRLQFRDVTIVYDAIDALSRDRSIDLLNLSLGSKQPSQIEHDAIIDAYERGTVCVCAAGNDDISLVGTGLFPREHTSYIKVRTGSHAAVLAGRHGPSTNDSADMRSVRINVLSGGGGIPCTPDKRTRVLHVRKAFVCPATCIGDSDLDALAGGQVQAREPE